MRTGIELFLYFIGIPALVILAIQVPDYIEHWMSAEDRAEQKELYTIIGDQEVAKIATKYSSGSMVCIDSFNDAELPMEFEQVWVKAQYKSDEIPLRGSVSLSTGKDFFLLNGLSPDVPPDNCSMENEELNGPFVIGKVRKTTAQCNRTAMLSEFVSQTIESPFWILSEDGDILKGAQVRTWYDISCDLKVTRERQCLPRDYGSKLHSSLTHTYDFGAFTDYNYCDNPENSEFKRQVLDKWERSKKLKEAIDEG